MFLDVPYLKDMFHSENFKLITELAKKLTEKKFSIEVVRKLAQSSVN